MWPHAVDQAAQPQSADAAPDPSRAGLQHQGEGRALKLRLTEEGKALIPGILAEFEAQEARIFASVPEKYRADLVAILRALRVKD
jgi:hypothetical protein